MAENLENTIEQGQDNNTETETKQGKYYTDEDIALIEQKAGDKRISQYMKTQEKKNREASKLANMSDTEKYEYSLQQKEAELEERENKLALLEMTNTASKILSEKGLSLELVDFVVNADADVTNENIKKLEKAFKASVKTEVEKRLGSNVPKKNLMEENELTKEKWANMNILERQKLKSENPEIYNKFASKR